LQVNWRERLLFGRIENDIGGRMMDVREAIKGLDGYAEVLVSLSTMLGANLFEEKSDQREALLVQLKQMQTDGRSIVLMMTKEIHTVGTKTDGSGDLTGISAAIQRYVAADQQASEAAKKMEIAKKPNEMVEAIRRFQEEIGWYSGTEPV
jgi:hypothetical protein